MSFLVCCLINIFDVETITGYEALRAMEDVGKVGGDFIISFYKYSRTRRVASTKLETMKNCRTRAQLPREQFSIDGSNLFLFESGGEPKMCYKLLIRFVGFSFDNYKLKKVKWFND